MYNITNMSTPNTSDRLQTYYDFDSQVLENISRSAYDQNQLSFRELATKYGIADGPSVVTGPLGAHPLEILEFVPAMEYDSNYSRIYHTGIGNSVGGPLRMHGLRLFGADPTQRLIMIGNPSSLGHAPGKISFRQSGAIMRTKSLAPAVSGLHEYLSLRGIKFAAHIGYSYGADKALTASATAFHYGQTVDKLVAVEPVTIAPQNLPSLLKKFIATRHQQRRYVEQSDSKPYDELWHDDSLFKFAAYSAGLLRLSNIAVAQVLTRGGYSTRLKQALNADSDLQAVTAWGTKSELISDSLAYVTLSRLAKHNDNSGRVRSSFMRLKGMHHAGADDIDLHAAIFLEALSRNC